MNPLIPTVYGYDKMGKACIHLLAFKEVKDIMLRNKTRTFTPLS